MDITSQIESIKEVLRATQVDMPEGAEAGAALRSELNALWMAIDAIASTFDEGKKAMGL